MGGARDGGLLALYPTVIEVVETAMTEEVVLYNQAPEFILKTKFCTHSAGVARARACVRVRVRGARCRRVESGGTSPNACSHAVLTQLKSCQCHGSMSMATPVK